MSSILDHPSVRDAVFPITVEQYRALGDAGIIHEQTELLRGVILQKMNKSPLHAWTVEKLRQAIESQLPAGCILRKEDPLTLGQSEPEPDLAIVQGSSDEFRMCHPTTAVLVVEVALASEAVDLAKAPIYADSQIAEYWVVLPNQKCIERFSQPQDGRYAVQERVTSPQIETVGEPRIAVQLSDIF